MSEIVLAELRGPIAVLTLNDPDRANPLSSAMMVALSAELVPENSSNRGIISVLTVKICP